MANYLLSLVLLPLIISGVFLMLGNKLKFLRTALIILVSAVMSISAVLLCLMLIKEGNVLELTTESLPKYTASIIMAIDFIIIAVILFFGVKLKNIPIIILSILQAVGAVYFEFFMHPTETHLAIRIDYLSIIMLLLSSILGSLVAIYGIGYMKEHEHHLHLEKTKQNVFFSVIFLFLSAMNALTVLDNISWIYTMWEITTLCSFLLISHDKTKESIKNATTALMLNSLGGAAFFVGIILIFASNHSLSVSELLVKGKGAFIGFVPLAMAFLCVAGFTKSAQFPFHKWLSGAMVAPTPVSALLHSSTMVKAGVYIIVRLSPVFAGGIFGTLVSVIGAFTFMAASAIAISQSNGKKVLAYSTIANLGLVIACAGIGNNIALAAAMLLIIYHGISKCLLFLCVGIVEQTIESRNIEDMQGIFKKMPFTTVVMVLGMISMLLPPFGVLATKWLAIEVSVYSPLVMVLIIVGSAFTVVFWVKWIGIILTMSHKDQRPFEKLSPSVGFSLITVLTGVFLSSIFLKDLFNILIAGQLKMSGYDSIAKIAGGFGGLVVQENAVSSMSGAYSGVAIIFSVLLLIVALFIIIGRVGKTRIIAPYVCGELANNDIRGIEFTGPMDKVSNIEVHNYYLDGAFNEEKLSIFATVISTAIILVLFGVIL